MKRTLALFSTLLSFACAQALQRVETEKDIWNSLPSTVESTIDLREATLKQFYEAIEKIPLIPADERTYENTIGGIDDALGHLEVLYMICEGLAEVIPEDALREEIIKTKTEIATSRYRFLMDGKPFLQAIEQTKAQIDTTTLSEEQRYYINLLERQFKHYGANLSEEKHQRVGEILGELSQTFSQFRKTLSDANDFLLVERAQLAGLSDEFVDNLLQIEGQYKLTLDYPTYFHIMIFCKNEQTRKDLLACFYNRAHPKNTAILKEMIQLRKELASLMGYDSYAAYELSMEMVKTPQRASKFIQALNKEVAPVREWEMQLLHNFAKEECSDVSGVWNTAYYGNQYNQIHHNVDTLKFAEYFPLEHTFDGLMKIYEQFFDIKIEKSQPKLLWDPELYLMKISSKEGELLGHVILDIFPRKNKYSHACSVQLLPSYKDYPGLNLVVMNFSRPTKDKPSLMNFREMTTFFHEFGHAIHGILGKTNHILTTGTGGIYSTYDFVELPSQILEEWLKDKEILIGLSSHYKTHEPIEEEMVDNFLRASKNFTACRINRQCFLSMLSLEMYGKEPQDPDALFYSLSESIMAPNHYPQDIHMPSTFGHLEEYASRYYGYLWSRALALDVFEQIKKEGLLNPEAGRRYVKEIIGNGSSKDPNEMLESYLGRKPSLKPFLNSLK